MRSSLFRLLVTVSVGAFIVACEGERGPAGSGADGTSCTITNDGAGTSIITCEDGTTATVTSGADGVDCTVADDGMGTKTITCDDGTTATVTDGTDVDPDALNDILDQLAADAEPETCAVCHNGVGADHQANYDDYSDTSTLELAISGATTANDPVCEILKNCTKGSDCTDGTCDSMVNGAGVCLGQNDVTKCTEDADCTDNSCESGFCTGQFNTVCVDKTCDSVDGAGYGICSGEYGVTMTFSVDRDGLPYVDAYNLPKLDQKRFYIVRWNGTMFVEPVSFGFITPTGTDGEYTAFGISAYQPAAVDALAYGYVGDDKLDTEGMSLYNDVSNAGYVFGTINYAPKADVAGCEKCHGKPYMKHGYRAAELDVAPDFAACKTCHYDNRKGGHEDWQILADNPERYAELHDGADMTAAEETKYAYTANVMNDVHMSHAMEFPYPASMSSCVTCHETALEAGTLLVDANFTRATCRSCHALTGNDKLVVCKLNECTDDTDCDGATCTGGFCPGESGDCDDDTCENVTGSTGTCTDEYQYGTYEKSMQGKWDAAGGVVAAGHDIAWFDEATATHECNNCHVSGGMATTLMSDLHNGGYNKLIYVEDPSIHDPATGPDGVKFSDVFTVTIDTATYNSTTNALTVTFSAAESSTTPHATLDPEDIVPTILIGLYGWDSKDYIVGPHERDAARNRLLEYEIGATNPRFTVNAAPNGAGSWSVTADLSEWADGTTATYMVDGTVKRAEIAVMPELQLGGETLALNAPSKTFDFTSGTTGAFDDYFDDIVDVAGGCNDCHDALATTFHSGDRGGNIKVCRLCHITKSGGSHLEMQSRSIDSYIHAIHSFQAFDPGDIDFENPVQRTRYQLHTEHVYPNFTIKNCKSCHKAGMFEVPDQSKSMPGLQSKSDPFNADPMGELADAGPDRAIPAIPAYVTGPGSRACGGCHRAHKINEDDANGLIAFNQHTKENGYLIEDDTLADGVTEVLDFVIETIMGIFE